ncbi:MAG TPA: VanZ family protein [Gemmatimonadales bacterium]|nr:VanZ family protein [Gemmatimonadales bacterium]
MNRRIAWAGVALSTLGILVATLQPSGTTLAPGWSFDLSSGESAIADLIANLLLFIPLGACLVLAGVRPLRAILLGAALSFSVEFSQQWIPGRDPSVGDVIANTTSTAIGVALVLALPRALHATPQQSGWQALGIAIAAIVVWSITGILTRPIFPPAPYWDVWTPNWDHWGLYRGKVLGARLDGIKLSQSIVDTADPHSAPPDLLLKTGQSLQVTAVWPARPPHRKSPLVALLDRDTTKVLILAADGTDLMVRYYSQAIALRMEQPASRWRHALARLAPQDTFLVQTWRGERGICLSVNSERSCGYGHTIGEGWELIYYPEHFPAWLYALLDMTWIAGWVVGIGYGTLQAGRTPLWYAAAAIVVAGLAVVPMVTGLKTTPIVEWLGAAIGLAGPLVVRKVATLRSRQSGFKMPARSF